MSTATIDQRRRSFDQMVELYARARGSAPAELFDALAAYVPAPADALEIGCGPGNASLPLLERGFRIHAGELGENLVAFARERALRQVVKVLRPGGALALIWGSPRRTAEDNRVDEALHVA
jgi:SAM-dependent methyltransferase